MSWSSPRGTMAVEKDGGLRWRLARSGESRVGPPARRIGYGAESGRRAAALAMTALIVLRSVIARRPQADAAISCRHGARAPARLLRSRRYSLRLAASLVTMP